MQPIVEESKKSDPRPYSAPQLTLYGAVRELTSGGSIGTPEGMMKALMMHV